jgi:hypothetical protein
MTEPDEALMWARKQNFPIYQHHTLAQAYRAGQTASAERIKALEEALKDSATAMQLTLDAVERHNTESDTFLSGFPLHVMSRRIAEARALLKEADQ